MSAVDWGAVLADLQRRRAEIEQAIASIQMFAPMPNGETGNSATGASWDGNTRTVVAPVGRGDQGVAPARARRKTTGGPDAATLTKMRQQWEAGAKVDHIAKACGVSVSVVYYNSSRGKWKRGTPTKGGSGITVGKTTTPAGAALAGRVRCPHCQEWTETDPCTHCKKRMAKW